MAGIYAGIAIHGARMLLISYPGGRSAIWALGRTRDLAKRAGAADLTTAFRTLRAALRDDRGQLDAGYKVLGLRVGVEQLASTERAAIDLFALRYGQLPHRDRHVGRIAAGATEILRPVRFEGVSMAPVINLMAEFDEDPPAFKKWARRTVARPPSAYALALDRQTVTKRLI
jgi:hypothetical protein